MEDGVEDYQTMCKKNLINVDRRENIYLTEVFKLCRRLTKQVHGNKFKCWFISSYKQCTIGFNWELFKYREVERSHLVTDYKHNLSSPRGARAFHELRRYHTRPLRLNWGPENVHFGKTQFWDPNINVRIFLCFEFSTRVPKNGPKNVHFGKTHFWDLNINVRIYIFFGKFKELPGV